MLKATSKFLLGLYKMGPLVWLWLAILMFLNLIAPLFFWPAQPAIIVVVFFLLAFMAMILLTHRYGFTRILGLGHFHWIPLNLYLIWQMALACWPYYMFMWMLATVVCNSISLVIDITDVVRYQRGDKTPLVTGLPGDD